MLVITIVICKNQQKTRVRDKLFDDKAIEQLIKQVLEDKDKTNTVLPVLENQLKEIEKGIDNIINAIQQGVNSPAATKRLNELEKEKRDVELAIAKEEMTHNTLTEEKLRMWFERFRKLDLSKLENRRRLIDCFVNAIYLFDDKVVITLNYENGTETIPYEEIVSSDLGAYVNAIGEPKKPRLTRGFHFAETVTTSRFRAFFIFRIIYKLAYKTGLSFPLKLSPKTHFDHNLTTTQFFH